MWRAVRYKRWETRVRANAARARASTTYPPRITDNPPQRIDRSLLRTPPVPVLHSPDVNSLLLGLALVRPSENPQSVPKWCFGVDSCPDVINPLWRTPS